MANQQLDTTKAEFMLRTLCAAIVVIAAQASAPMAVAAGSDDPVSCPPGSFGCTVEVETPPAAGGGGGGGGNPSGGSAVCKVASSGAVVPCSRPDWGWWNGDSCYYREMSPQPAPTDAVWAGKYPEGSVYEGHCIWDGNPADVFDYVLTWFATPPPGTPVTPEQLAQRAVDAMTLKGADIRTAPPAGAMALVGLPVWLWTAVGPTTWGPNSATASVPGLSVTAVAKATKIVWDLGDGTRLTCTGPGTAYSPSSSTTQSPTCGHVYRRSSAARPGHVYTITATTTWQITWSGGGQGGALTRTRASSTTVRVGELEVLVG